MPALVTDELWDAIAPHLPPHPPAPKGGRPRVGDRAALAGILFVLREGLRWQSLPAEMGCGSGSTCWRGSPSGPPPESGTRPMPSCSPPSASGGCWTSNERSSTRPPPGP